MLVVEFEVELVVKISVEDSSVDLELLFMSSVVFSRLVVVAIIRFFFKRGLVVSSAFPGVVEAGEVVRPC